jgi:hypothetical protein
VVRREYWLPVPKMTVPGVSELIERYQARAASQGADALGYYVAPLAIAKPRRGFGSAHGWYPMSERNHAWTGRFRRVLRASGTPHEDC